MPPSTTLVRVDRADAGPARHVAELVLDRPEAKNAVSTDDGPGDRRRDRRWPGRHRARVVLTSESRRRSASGPTSRSATPSPTPTYGAAAGGRAAYGGVLDLPVPAIAAVDGFALGAASSSRCRATWSSPARAPLVGLPEVSVGVIPGGGGTQLLVRRSGGRGRPRIDLHRRPDRRARGRLGSARSTRSVAAGTARDVALELAGGHRRELARWGCATPSGRCGSAPTWTWRPGWRSRTPAGGRPP